MPKVRASRAPEGLYTLREVCQFTGAKPTQVQHWVRVGVLDTEAPAADGRGHHRLFAFADLVKVVVCLRLNEAGYSQADLSAALTALQAVSSPSPIDERLGPELAAAARHLYAEWPRFADPNQRPTGIDYYVCGGTRVLGPYVETGWTVMERPEVIEMLSHFSDVHLVSLRRVLEELEMATGASWPRSDANA